jgi:hypothetical protein
MREYSERRLATLWSLGNMAGKDGGEIVAVSFTKPLSI